MAFAHAVVWNEATARVPEMHRGRILNVDAVQCHPAFAAVTLERRAGYLFPGIVAKPISPFASRPDISFAIHGPPRVHEARTARETALLCSYCTPSGGLWMSPDGQRD